MLFHKLYLYYIYVIEIEIRRENVGGFTLHFIHIIIQSLTVFTPA